MLTTMTTTTTMVVVEVLAMLVLVEIDDENWTIFSIQLLILPNQKYKYYCFWLYYLLQIELSQSGLVWFGLVWSGLARTRAMSTTPFRSDPFRFFVSCCYNWISNLVNQQRRHNKSLLLLLLLCLSLISRVCHITDTTWTEGWSWVYCLFGRHISAKSNFGRKSASWKSN